MADLLSILSQASTSLSAHRTSAATASHNLSNASTPGFARQRAELQTTLPAEFLGSAFVGRGVGLLTVSQARDRFLEAQVPGARGQAASTAAHSQVLQAVSALDPDAGAGLTAALGDFYASLRVLSQNPAEPGLRQAAVSSARTLALAFNRTGEALDAARAGVDARLGGAVEEVNALAASVADLNRQIRIARASGAEPNDLLDARLRAADRLADLVGARPVPDAAGDLGLSLVTGVALVTGDRAARLSALPDPANGGHLQLRLTHADGSGPVALSAAQLGGEARGLLDARDVSLAKSAAALDTLAFDLGGALNAVHQAGFALDGSTGRDLFLVGGAAAGAARRLAVEPSMLADPKLLAASGSATTLPGDGSALLLLLGTERQALSAGLDAAGALSGLIADFGASASRVAAASEHDGALLGHVESMRESVSGVSIDEEMINLTRAQRAFEAVMKVMKTTDEMLETLLSLK